MTDQTPLSSEYASLDGRQFKSMLLAGMAWLEQHYQIVNQLNVFPVPDGDTGINMLLTMQSAYSEIAELDDPHVGNVARKFAKGAVNGSRGNSGVILSQIWRGFSVALRELERLDTPGFVSACETGTRFAYDAAPKPAREGTILTIIREVSERLGSEVETRPDLRDLLVSAVDQANDALVRTPDMLPILKQAGVVDSGGQGLTFILEGMLRHLRGESLEAEMVAAAAAAPGRKQVPVMSAMEFGHPYDVQMLVTGTNLDVEHIRVAIEKMGDSTIVTSDGDTTVKIHVHVFDPGQPISYASRLGVISDVVVENMYQQYLENIGVEVVEAPKPTVELLPGDVAVVAVSPGDGLARVFYEQGAARLVSGGQTMNPSVEEICTAINELSAEKVIFLPNNSNIVLAAQQAARKCKDKQVVVLPSKNVPQGVVAMFQYANVRLHEANRNNLDLFVEQMSEALEQVMAGEVTTAVRSVEIDGVRAEAGQLIGLLEGKIVVSGADLAQLMHDLIGRLDSNAYELVTLYYGSNVTAAEAQDIGDALGHDYPYFSFEVVAGGQPHYHFFLSIE